MPSNRVGAGDIDPRLDEISSSLFRLAVKAVIIRDHKILLVKETGDEWWSLPGGGIDHGETPIQALVRELQEELGVAPEDIETDGQVIMATSDAVVDHIPKANLFYKVSLHAQEVRMPDVVEFGWYTAQEMAGLYLSPSAGEVNKQLLKLLS